MFLKIEAKNFLSWKHLTFDFVNGITLIDGVNCDDNTSEGSGKSSICESLVWCLYGQCTKDVNIDDVIHVGQKSCEVSITLVDGVKIVRSRKPNDLYIENGKITKGKDVKDTQKLINQLIGMSFDTFCQAVYFPQNYPKKFISATQEDKAKILSELQDLSIFDRASKKATDRYRQIKTVDLPSLDINQGHKLQLKTLLESEYATFNRLSETYQQDKNTKLNEIMKRKRELSSLTQSVNAQIVSFDYIQELATKIKDLSNIETNLRQCEFELNNIKSLTLQHRQSLENKVCSSCNRPLPGDQCLIEIPSDTELLRQQQLLLSQLSELKQAQNEFQSLRQQNAVLTEKLNNLKSNEQLIVAEIERLENSHNPYLTKITDLQARLEQTRSELVDLKQKIEHKKLDLTHFEFLKEGFKEIKSHVFRTLLNELNEKTNKYIQQLFEIPVNIKFDNVSDEGEISKIQTVIQMDGTERGLGLLSGGQFKRVQLATDFALSDIVSQRANNPINLRILDEAFKDLSESSMSKVLDILQNMPGTTLLIEHNSVVKNIVDNVYHIELKNGTSNKS